MQTEMFPGIVGSNHCHDSQVMSAIIKCVRLRRTEDAVYWFTHFAKFWPKERFRLSRRILIMAAEDCLNTQVQWAIADWFARAPNIKNDLEWYRSAVAQIHLICSTKNWWQSIAGWHYIYRWYQAELATAALAAGDKEEFIGSHWAWDAPKLLFIQHNLLKETVDWTGKKIWADNLVERARLNGNLKARIPAAIHSRFAKTLGKDDNYLGHALYRLSYGDLGDQSYPVVKPETVHANICKALARLQTPEKTPKWVQDGIHCYGSDKRFAGEVKYMMGCCRAFDEWGRLDPADPHHPTYYDVEAFAGLLTERGFQCP